MALDSKTVQTIARLAQLQIEDSELGKYQSELSNILAMFEQMDTIDTTDVAPMTHPFDATLRMRNDEVTETNLREHYQAVAPNAENGLYLVPKVID